MKRHIVLLGPPASGKGTQAELIKAHYGLQTASTGAMLREETEKGSELGKLAHELTSQGGLVPDSLMVQLVEQWIGQHHEGFVLDGFPRTLAQGEALEDILSRHGLSLDAVFYFETPDSVIIDRILNRLTCSSCGRISRIGMQVSSDTEECPACGGKLNRRADDNLVALERRMAEYREKTEGLVQYYRERGLLFQLEAAERPETVFAEISKILETTK